MRLAALVAAVLWLIVAGGANLARAQSEPADGGATDLPPPADVAPAATAGLDALRAQIELVEVDDSLGEAEREALLAELDRTRALLERGEARRARIRALEGEAAARERTLAALAAELSAPVTDRPRPGPGDSIATLEATAARVERELVEAMAALFAARHEAMRLDGRAPRIAERIAGALRRAELATGPPAGGVSAGASASRGREAARLELLEESRELAARLRWQDGADAVVELRRELATLPARRTIAAARTLLATERVARLARALGRHRRALTDARVSAAAADVIAASALVDAETDGASAASRAATALALARRRLDLVRDELQAARGLARTRAELVELHGVQSTIDGLTRSALAPDDLAGLLRGLDERLPERAALLAALAETERARSALQAERFGWEERVRERSADDPLGVAASLAGVPEAAPDAPARARADDAPLLIALVEAADRLSDSLTEREIVLRESLVRTEDIDAFLSRSLLGLRTDETTGLAWLARTPAGLARLLDASAWRDALAGLRAGIDRHPVRALAFAAAVAGLLVARRRLRRRLEELAERVGNVGRDAHWVTPAALMTSVPQALPLPLLLWFASLQLGRPDGGALAGALGEALGRIAPVVFAFELVRVLARPEGVLHRHLGWSRPAALALGRDVLWLEWILLTAGLLIVLAAGATQSDLRYGIGVPALLGVSLALALFVHGCFHPSRGVAAAIAPERPVPRAMVALYPVLLLGPVAIGALSLVGYFDTAIELQLRILGSLLIVMVAVLAHGLARRAHQVAHRRLALRRVRKLRAHRERERLAGTTVPASGQASPAPIDESEEVALDLARGERQTRRILADAAALVLLLGMWLVWRTLLPALEAPDAATFDRAAVAGAAAGAGAADAIEGAASAIAPGGLSLRGVVLALFLITVGLIASRNIGGILELAVFERLRLDAGARYAIVAIAGYVLVGAGLVAGLSQLGVDWSKLQWIVAALGVGLGFGLQEIVANFVSGLIILFERPIRVGDVVTIGNLTGTVSNIRIRATTVTDFDNLEVMLPNKTIITENVTNWTLSDSVTRILLSVGVAFDSDVERVRALLERAVRETEDILDEPEWTVFFVRHGENALIFELRVFVPTPTHRLPVTHALNARMKAALDEAGIEIPHPQRAVTLRRRVARSG